MRDTSIPVLWHIRVSNYNEKVRWALDYKGIAHRRRAPMPGGHMLVALFLTRRTPTFPVLDFDGRAIGDSTAIIAALEASHPEPPLYPADPEQRRQALELEEFFDENLGHDIRRVVFAELLKHPDVMRSRAGDITTDRQGRVLAAGLPAFMALIRRRYSISEARAAQSMLRVRAALALIEEILGGGEHLVGDSFTVADLTAAALMAPLLSPEQFPYPTRAAFPAELESTARELEDTPGGAWVMRTYARHRPRSSRVTGRRRSVSQASAPSRCSRLRNRPEPAANARPDSDEPRARRSARTP